MISKQSDKCKNELLPCEPIWSAGSETPAKIALSGIYNALFDRTRISSLLNQMPRIDPLQFVNRARQGCHTES